MAKITCWNIKNDDKTKGFIKETLFSAMNSGRHNVAHGRHRILNTTKLVDKLDSQLKQQKKAAAGNSSHHRTE